MFLPACQFGFDSGLISCAKSGRFLNVTRHAQLADAVPSSSTIVCKRSRYLVGFGGIRKKVNTATERPTKLISGNRQHFPPKQLDPTAALQDDNRSGSFFDMISYRIQSKQAISVITRHPLLRKLSFPFPRNGDYAILFCSGALSFNAIYKVKSVKTISASFIFSRYWHPPFVP